MIDHADQFLSEQEIKKAIAAGVAKTAKGVPKQKQIQMLTELLKFPVDSIVRDPDATEIRNEIAKTTSEQAKHPSCVCPVGESF
jgi:hypothetical protein